jgi:hypothetical protein
MVRGKTAVSTSFASPFARHRLRGGDDRGFESFDPLLGLRFFPLGRTARSSARVELGALAPFWGHDRTDLMVGLNAGWAWGASKARD